MSHQPTSVGTQDPVKPLSKQPSIAKSNPVADKPSLADNASMMTDNDSIAPSTQGLLSDSKQKERKDSGLFSRMIGRNSDRPKPTKKKRESISDSGPFKLVVNPDGSTKLVENNEWPPGIESYEVPNRYVKGQGLGPLEGKCIAPGGEGMVSYFHTQAVGSDGAVEGDEVWEETKEWNREKYMGKKGKRYGKPQTSGPVGDMEVIS